MACINDKPREYKLGQLPAQDRIQGGLLLEGHTCWFSLDPVTRGSWPSRPSPESETPAPLALDGQRGDIAGDGRERS
jgi:hypothetical protein